MFYKIKLLKEYIVYRWWFRKTERWYKKMHKYFGCWYELGIPRTTLVLDTQRRWGVPRRTFSIIHTLGPVDGVQGVPVASIWLTKRRVEILYNSLRVNVHMYHEGTRLMRYLWSVELPKAENRADDVWVDAINTFSTLFGAVPYTEIEAARYIGDTVWYKDQAHIVRGVAGNHIRVGDNEEVYLTFEEALAALQHFPDDPRELPGPFGNRAF